MSHDYTLDSYSILRKLSINNNWPALKGREFHVLSCLLWHSNSVTFQCNPSYKKLAEEMKCSKGSVQTAIDGLRMKGFLQLTRRFNESNGHNTSGQFWIMIDIQQIHKAMADEDTRDFIEMNAAIDVVSLYESHFDR